MGGGWGVRGGWRRKGAKEMGHSFCGRCSCIPPAGPTRGNDSCWLYGAPLWLPHEPPVVARSASFSVWLLLVSFRQHAWLGPLFPSLYQASETSTFILSWEGVEPSPKSATWVFCHQTGHFQPQHLMFNIFTRKTLKFLKIHKSP